MKLHQLFKSTAAALACAGMLVPSGVSQAAAPPQEAVDTPRQTADPPKADASQNAKPPAVSETVIRDIELSADGVFQGQVLNAKKEASGGVVISIRHDRKEIGRLKSDDRGRFAVKGVKPGVYYVVAGTGHGLYRVWKNGIAPPKALQTARIISDKSLVVRGQGPTGEILYDENGVAYGQVQIVDNGGLVPVSPGLPVGAPTGFIDSIGVYDVLLVGAASAGLAVGIVALDEADDDDASP